MPDISMCSSEICPLTKKCYRHEDSGTKPTPMYQSYMLFDRENPRYKHDALETKLCIYFLERFEKTSKKVNK
jgi:hypothetical protein